MSFPVKWNAYDKNPRWDRESAMDKAFAAVAHLPEKPKMDEQLLQLKQLWNMAHVQLDGAKLAEESASRVRDRAETLLKEITLRIELRERAIGIGLQSESDSLTSEEEHA